MPTVTVSGAGTSVTLTYTSNDSVPYANTLANAISAALQNGSLTAFPYTSGATTPGGPGGVAFFATSPSQTVAVPTSDVGIIDAASGPVSITGGGVGETVVAGSGGLTYTGITPSGSAVDYIAAGDGANFIATATTGTGNYQVNTGAGNDTISVFGNGVVNAGTGNNSVSVSGGSSLIYSEGHDSITTSGVGTDTINVGTGTPTINPGSANLVVTSSSTAGALFIAAGTGSDTISVGPGGGAVYAGSGGNSILVAGTVGANGAATTLHGGGGGDQLYASGSTAVYAAAGPGNETLSGAGGTPAGGVSVAGSTASNTFLAGTGNDTLIAGAGKDTLVGASGHAVMTSGTGADVFSFTSGTAGGMDTITGFKAADTLALTGYGSGPVPTTTMGGSTVVHLSDGTSITIQGVSALNPSQIVLK